MKTFVDPRGNPAVAHGIAGSGDDMFNFAARAAQLTDERFRDLALMGCQLLLSNNPDDPDTSCEIREWSPLVAAAAIGRRRLVELFLRVGAEPDQIVRVRVGAEPDQIVRGYTALFATLCWPHLRERDGDYLGVAQLLLVN